MTGPTARLRPADPGTLGPWRLLGVLGEGGMGVVYLGRSGRRIAAVKTLRPELLAEGHYVDRFRRERQAVEAIRHPHVARLLGADLDGPRPWLATEFVAGPTLERCVEDRGPLPEPAVRALGALLASALAALHTAGVVHRDLKPSNVLLAADGPRLVDFGIARIPAATTVTVTGQRPGSPGYMSPEQVLGQELGPPSDVFTLGALLTYASTGHHAFDAAGFAPVDYAIAHEEPRLTGVPAPLAPALRHCLDKDPRRRPTAGELTVLWSPAARRPRSAGNWLPPYVVADVRERERAARELTGVRALPRRRVLGAAGALLALGGGGAAWWAYGREEGRGRVPLWDGAAGEQPEPLWSATDLDPAMPFGPAVAGDVLLVARPDRVSALDPRTGDRLWTCAGGRAPAPRAPGPVLIGRDGVVRGLDSRTGKESWRGPGGLVRLLAVDAEAVYATDPAGRLVAVRTGDATPRWRSRDALDARGGAVATAGDGTVLVTTRDGEVVALDSATGKQAWAVRGSARGLRAAHGDGLAVIGGATLRGLALGSGTQRWTVRPSGTPGEFGAPVVHDGQVYVADGDQVRCLGLKDGSGLRVASGAGGDYAPDAPPVVAAHGLYLPLATGPDGIAALPLTGDTERYRFAPSADRDAPWAVATTGGVVVMQNGGHLYALPRF
ncbi:protein kinase domain-containing protein [Streptomyces longispororuber]|uniref:protein kinase domain-containing protein n=1 Tax=Streptomyces longispororuber TaxID=68230 RepID=UPI00210D2DC6|nr:PQQ-binding-like beta-propeller repeat protein [Streptomyces longispororuber]MCQ4208316.1 protein kinase [Streptomyces longispororuber]